MGLAVPQGRAVPIIGAKGAHAWILAVRRQHNEQVGDLDFAGGVEVCARVRGLCAAATRAWKQCG